ncbi:ABC transporter substrate-binding protein [Shouchella lehensis]|uniref:Extracellular solute-binding protein n=1 Tax=Shouchella lehensis G1 TaxID=1246626 RepID=A0A060M0L4_9BACI|nr:extracellular solute-binding protein [Shouchella lehensis]AIC93594.1 extracellular solute-binding protein [Shouchella lehensis G1]RQW21834.1 extracellular solute-binding protein [Bacillus sp. C1-1]
MKRRTAITLVASVMLIGGCSSQTNSDMVESSEDIEIVSEMEGSVRVAVAGMQLENGIDPITGVPVVGLNEFIEVSFNGRYPNISVNVTTVPWENAMAGQSALLQSNDVDVLYSGGAFASQWQARGLLKNLNPLMEADTSFDPAIYLEGVWQSSFSILGFDGETRFGLPAIAGSRMTMYDKQLFDDWGVEYLSENPTPEEILEKAALMTGENPVTGEQNYGVWFDGASLNGSTFIALMHAYGANGGEGSIDDPGNIEWHLNTPEMKKAVEAYAALTEFVPPEFVNAQGRENFGTDNNTIAINLDGNGAAVMGEYLGNENEDILNRYESSMNLGIDGNGWVPIDPFVMAENAQDEDAAWEFMKFMAGPIAQEWGYNNFKYSPTLTEAAFVLDEDKFTEQNREIADVSHSIIIDEANPFVSGEMVPRLNGFVSSISSGAEVNIDDFLNDIQAEAEKWSEQNK